MITLLGFVLLVYLLVVHSSLSRRVSDLESRQSISTVRPQQSPETAVNMNLGQNVQAAVNMAGGSASHQNLQYQQYNAEPNKFFLWLKEDWLMKLGAALFIIGFGWFVSYAFINNWIGPVGRISIGIITGAIIMALGFKRMMKHPSQGAVFMALGAGMAMLTIFAGRSIYGFFTPFSAVAFDFAIVAFVSFASYKFKVRELAYLAQILAFVSPLLAAGQTNSVFLFSYLLFISAATLFLAGITGWRKLISTSLFFVGLYSLPYIFAGGSGFFFSGSIYANDAPVILNFAYLFSMLYLLSGMFTVVKKGVQDESNEIALAVMNGVFLFLWIYNIAPKEWSSMIFAAWAVVFAFGSFAAFKFSSKLAPFYAYGSVAVAFIATATSIELRGASLVIAFAMEALLILLTVLSLTKDTKAAGKAAMLFVFPIVLSVSSITGYSNSVDLFSADFFALALMAVALISAGRILNHLENQTKSGNEINFGSVLIVLGTFYIGYIIWQFIHIFMKGTPDLATMATLVIFTIFGLIAYFAGLYGNDIARRTYGMVLLAFVVIRLVFIDVWDMELFGRVITFLAIGVLLMSTAFLTKKKKNEITQ
ncbi:DUF2339 domain-containing protein [Candidatus Nomurabacteria bacterium]|nr:DUF2339 domain-containing protein [Candidatus Nomurabacteria bacterium]